MSHITALKLNSYFLLSIILGEKIDSNITDKLVAYCDSDDISDDDMLSFMKKTKVKYSEESKKKDSSLYNIYLKAKRDDIEFTVVLPSIEELCNS